MSTIRFQLGKNGVMADLDIIYDSLYAIGYAGRDKE